MEDLSAYRRQHRWELLLKAIDQIHSTFKNLDDIIFKTKNFGFLFWGGSLYLIVEHLSNISARMKMSLIFPTGLIPLLFWVMDYNWRKHLLRCSRRKRHLSHFHSLSDLRLQILGLLLIARVLYSPLGLQWKILLPYFANN